MATKDVSRSVEQQVEEYNRYAESLVADSAVKADQMQETMVRDLMAATTLDEILDAGQSLSSEAILDVPILVTGIRASVSTLAEGPRHYLHVDAAFIGTGERVTFSCGASDVVRKLIRMSQLDLFPAEVKIVKARQATADGYFPLFLTRA